MDKGYIRISLGNVQAYAELNMPVNAVLFDNIHMYRELRVSYAHGVCDNVISNCLRIVSRKAYT